MRPGDYHSFISQIEGNGDLARIKCEVDPHLEAAAIIDWVCKREGGGKALLFEDIKGSKIPLVANLYGSENRMALALGIDDLEGLADKLRCDLSTTGEQTSEKALQLLVSEERYRPISVEKATCRAVDATSQGLAILPALQSWPEDGGKYLTLGQVFTCHPDTHEKNCGLYRIQVINSHTALLRCHPGSGGGEHLAAWHQRGEAMPVAIALGGPPAMTWAASLPLPCGIDEATFVGYLCGEPVAMVACQNGRLYVPADAEIIIEGRIFPDETMSEGPFGNHTGRYTPASPAPLLRVDAISMREDAVYPCTVVGPPPMENCHLAKAMERLLLPLLQHDCPWVVDLHMPIEGVFHRAAIVAVRDNCPLDFEEVRQVLRSSSLLRNSRFIVLLDADANLDDFSKLYWHIVNVQDCMKTISVTPSGVFIDARSVAKNNKVRQNPLTLKNLNYEWLKDIC